MTPDDLTIASIQRSRRHRTDRMSVRRRLSEHPTPTPLGTPCRLWQGAITADGYGYLYAFGKPVGVHRWVMAHLHGWDAIKGQVVMHLCDQPLCFRADHLRLGTHPENVADRDAKGRGGGGRRQGSRNGRSVLTVETAALIRQEWSPSRGVTPRLAAKYGVSEATIYRVAHGLAWGFDDGVEAARQEQQR